MKEFLLSAAKMIVSFLLLIVVFCISSIIFALPIMLCWNWIMAGVLGLVRINFIQAFGLSVLSRLLLTPATKIESN